MADTRRYEEARHKLLEILNRQPNHVNALVLLAKVEYYLRLFRSSRQRFETALTYEPGNMSAYFGLQFFTERKRRIGFIVSLASAFLVLLLLGFVAGTRIDRSLAALQQRMNQKLAELAAAVQDSETARLMVAEKMVTETRKLTERLENNALSIVKMLEETENTLELRNAELMRDLSVLTAEQKRVQKDLTDLASLTRAISREMEQVKRLLGDGQE